MRHHTIMELMNACVYICELNVNHEGMKKKQVLILLFDSYIIIYVQYGYLKRTYTPLIHAFRSFFNFSVLKLSILIAIHLSLTPLFNRCAEQSAKRIGILLKLNFRLHSIDIMSMN